MEEVAQTSIERVIRRTVAPNSQNDSEFASANEMAYYWPAMDVRETPRMLFAFIDLPGIDERTISLRWDKKCLWISGIRECEHDFKAAIGCIQGSRTFGRFLCRIPLGEKTHPESLRTQYKRGVLKVSLPKQ